MSVELGQASISELADTECDRHVLFEGTQRHSTFLMLFEISVNSVVSITDASVSVLNFVHNFLIKNHVLLLFVSLQSSNHSVDLVFENLFERKKLIDNLFKLLTFYDVIVSNVFLLRPHVLEKVCNGIVVKIYRLVKCVSKIFSVEEHIDFINDKDIHLRSFFFV